MRKVKCEECGKVYNFDMDDFCPRCGAFNQPPKASAINADGSVIRLDGINEKNHAGSFVHEELHEENRERRRMGLSKGTRRTAPAKPRFSAEATRPTVSRPAKQTNASGSPVGVIFRSSLPSSFSIFSSASAAFSDIFYFDAAQATVSRVPRRRWPRHAILQG